MMIKFTYCKDLSSAETKQLDWPRFVKPFKKSKEYPDKQASVARSGFIGGPLIKEGAGRADNVGLRTLAALDYDKITCPLEDVEPTLELALGSAALAYSTYRHTPDAPRLRIVVPLDSPVGREAYKAIVDDIADSLRIGTPDNCSYTMNQLMFLPSHAPGVEPYFCRVDGPFWPVGETGQELTKPDKADAEATDLAQLVAHQPLDIDNSEVDLLLENYPAEGLDYDEWARVGMALAHQFEGSEDGRQRWLSWSELSSKHNDRQMATKWRSFHGGGTHPVTLASIIKLAGGREKALGIAPGGGAFERLKAEAVGVDSTGAYLDFVQRVRGIGEQSLPEIMRAELRQDVFRAFAKSAGMTLGAVKKDMVAAKRPRGDVGEAGQFNLPEWAQDYVFCEETSKYERVSVRHAMNCEAFRTVYDRKPECVAAGVNAIQYVTEYCGSGLESVASRMYWPGQDKIFQTTDGLKRLNTYVNDGIEPAPGAVEDDPDGQGVVDLFLDHVKKLVPDEREQRMLIDFLAHVYQHPGQRVQWALLLFGIEGNGKSYIGHVMQLLLGSSFKKVSTAAIKSEFTSWAVGSVLSSIEEIRVVGADKYAVMNKLKPIISDDTVAIIKKGVDEKTMPNFSSWMMTTNHSDAIPVSDNDRRIAVITTAPASKDELLELHGGIKGVGDYFHRLFSESDRRADALARFLRDWTVSDDFSPRGRAPETTGLDDMRDANVSEERDQVEEAIDKHACEIVNDDIVDVTYLNDMVNLEAGSLPVKRTLAHILMDMGYKQIKKRRWRIYGKVRYIWFRRGKYSEKDVKEIVRLFHGPQSGFKED